jgi:hypothetical protein
MDELVQAEKHAWERYEAHRAEAFKRYKQQTGVDAGALRDEWSDALIAVHRAQEAAKSC